MRRSSLLIVIGIAVVAEPARADHSSLHATANGDVAATDNVFAVSRDNNPQADLFFQVRPGMLFAYDAPRMIHELNAEVEFLEYVAHSTKPSITLRGGWKAFYLPGPRSELTTSVNGGTGQLNALSSGTSPDQTGVTVTPGGRADVLQGDASEYFSWQATKEVRTSQTAFARYTNTDDAASVPPGPPRMNTSITVSEVGGAAGVERSFEKTSVSLEGGASYLSLARDAPEGVSMGTRRDRQLNPRATLTLRHDIDKHWSTNGDVGVVYVHPLKFSSCNCFDPYHPMEMHVSAPFPVFGALLAYTEAWGRATLNARRGVTPNQFIAQNTLTESVIAQVAMPLPWLDPNPHLRSPKLVGLASLGIERSQLIDRESSTLIGSFKVARVDAGVAWTPRRGTTYGLRYEFAYQAADATAASAIQTASYYRNTFYFTFALRYPDRVAVRVPRRGQSVRADRKDLSPIGAEPVVPDPTEQLPDEGQ